MCARERERERECVCVYVRERERERRALEEVFSDSKHFAMRRSLGRLNFASAGTAHGAEMLLLTFAIPWVKVGQSHEQRSLSSGLSVAP